MIQFDIPNTTAALLLFSAYIICVLTCFYCIKHRMSFRSYPRKKKVRITVFYGTMFWLVHPLILMSEGSIYVSGMTAAIVVLTVPFTWAALWIALSVASKNEVATLHFLVGTFLMGTMIFTLDSVLYSLSFSETLSVNWLILGYSFFMVLCISGAVLRFLLILNDETEEMEKRRWQIAGAVSIGVALSSIPHMIKASLTAGYTLTNFSFSLESIFFSLFINLLALIVLILVPDLFGDTQRKKTKMALLTNRAEYHSLFFNHPDAVFAIDHNERFIRMNETAKRTINRFSGNVSDICLQDVVTGPTYEKVKIYLSRAFEGRGSEFDLDLTGDRFFKVIILPLKMGNRTGAYAIVKDQTDSKKHETRIQHFAYHDDLTGLKNRRGFFQTLEQQNHPFSVVMIDFDHFKRINDVYGHDYGDLLLKELARRMNHRFGEFHEIARLGGDEFALLCRGDDRDALFEACTVFLRDFEEPIHIGGRLCYMTPSIGVAHSIDGERNNTVVSLADYAMFEAKNTGRNQLKVFEPSMKEDMERKKILEQDLPHAILNDELYIVYQPIWNVSDSRVGTVEALVRWQHPQLGAISPAEFIPVAEDLGEIAHLEEFVVTTACREVLNWNRSFEKPVCLSVNISMKHIEQTDIHQFITGRLNATGFPPECLTIELTETTLMQREGNTVEAVERLKSMGVTVHLDDFGSGYSSLNYLMQLPLNGVKLDRLFLQKMKKDNEHYTLVQSLISLKQKLGLDVVAEGVETEDHLRMLEEMGCQNIQGYYIARPLKGADCMTLLRGQTEEAAVR
ncbi:sensor domain-containing protein [Alteribacter natronophilus]|uniref:sensor domain-containing protein n=1 Tax=Alteribacter natronophilus TaxID=2583810 RepID=UPI00110F634C|nr:EAL domain-containing protein [Alteribacter natronophilus]TMW70138.1 EAL domain-containing protein [Alteribacter natronophilus]